MMINYLRSVTRAQFPKWDRTWTHYSITKLPGCPLSQKAELFTLVSCDQIYVTDPISSNKFWKQMHNRPQNDCGAKTDETPPQTCNQPENRTREHANLVRVKICHLSHRQYSSPPCSVMVKRVQNIILRSIIKKHSINSLQVGTHTCP